MWRPFPDATARPWQQILTVELTECIVLNGQPLCYVVRAGLMPKVSTFLTPPEFKQQVGYIVYPAGGEVPRHVHKALERHLMLMVGGGHGFRMLEETVFLEVKQGPYLNVDEKERF
jgi:hypothetical protein